MLPKVFANPRTAEEDGRVWSASLYLIVGIGKKSYGFLNFCTLKNNLAIEKSAWNALVLL